MDLKEKRKLYREKNKEHIRLKNKEYQEKNKDKIREKSAKKRNEHLTEIREYQKDYMVGWRKEQYEKDSNFYKDRHHKYRALHPEKCRAAQKKYRDNNKDKTCLWSRISGKKIRENLRSKLVEAYGGKCVKCGFDNPMALQVDHVNGGGIKHRATFKGNQMIYHRFLIKNANSGEFQLLCANCNQIKKITNKEGYRKPKF